MTRPASVPPRSFLRALLMSLFVWSPAMVALFALLEWRGATWWDAGVSYFISCVVSCAAIGCGRLGYVLLRCLGVHIPEGHRIRVGLAMSLPGVSLGLYLANLALLHGLPRFGHTWEPGPLGTWAFSTFIGLLFAAVSLLWNESSQVKAALANAQLQLTQLENQNLQAQLASLTAQVNPHLLFNALNTVVALIPTEPAKAEATVLQLAALYRGVLQSTERTSHPLARELDVCASYLAVEQARFGTRLTVRIDISPEVDPEVLSVPVLLLQPLVENAVRHGLSGRAAGGSIHVAATREGESLYLTVEDDGVGMGSSHQRGTGLGIPNARRRLMLAFGERGALEIQPRLPSGTRVMVRLPLQVGPTP